MTTRRKKLVTRIFLIALIGCSIPISVLAAHQTRSKPSNNGGERGKGKSKAIGIRIYPGNEWKTQLSSIDWGTLEPGSSKNFTCYIRNEDKKTALTPSMYPSNWNPSNASDHIILSWNFNGQPINPREAVQITFTLTISHNFTGTFNFDTTIIGSNI